MRELQTIEVDKWVPSEKKGMVKHAGDDFLYMSRIAAECSMMLNGRGEIVRFYEDERSFIAPPSETCLDTQIKACEELSKNGDVQGDFEKEDINISCR